MLAVCILLIVALPIAVWNYLRNVGQLMRDVDEWQ